MTLLVTCPAGQPNAAPQLAGHGNVPLATLLQESSALALLAPLSTVRFVDAATTVPAAQQNGSIGAPFATVQAAVNALAAVPGGVVYICPGNYPEAVTVGNNLRLTALGVFEAGTGANSGVGTSINGIPGVDILSVTFTPTTTAWLAITGCRVATVDASAATTTSVQINLINCYVPTTVGANYTLNTNYSTIGATATTVAAGRIVNAVNTQFSGAISLGFAGSTSVFADCAFAGAADITAVSATVTVQMCPRSNWNFKSVSNTITGTTLVTIQAALARAVLSPVVPVLLAGVLGTATASTVGTELEGITTVQGIAWNQLTTGAGIGVGALISVRVSSTANTLIFQFMGPTVGGAVDILVSRTTNRG